MTQTINLDEVTQNLALQIEQYGVDLSIHQGAFNLSQVRMLVYGESGVGKTVFASTWPDPIFLDIDMGLSSVKRKNVRRIAIRTWEDMKKAAAYVAQADHGCHTVVLDSLNELQKIIMDYIVRKFPNIKRAYESLPSQSDYGMMLNEFEKMCRYLRSLPMNVVFIAQMGGQQNESDSLKPLLTGRSTAEMVCRMMDVVAVLYKVDTSNVQESRAMGFDQTRYVTKDRSGKLPRVIIDPSYEKMAAFWQQEVANVTKTVELQ